MPAMDSLSKKEKDQLIEIAFQALKDGLRGKFSFPQEPALEKLKRKQASFVTLYLGKELRGCLGNLESIGPLFKSVYQNAWNAGFKDSRFSPLKKEELKDLGIEVSILSPLKKIKSEKEIKQGIDGVLLETENGSATFLPQVWEQIPEKKEFLKALVNKAGLGEEAWQDPKTRIFVYQVESF